MMHRSLLAAALVAMSTIGARADCFDEYLCIFHRWMSDNTEYSWDLRPLCRDPGNEYSWTDAQNHTYIFNVCGTVQRACVPAEWTVYVSHGVMSQFWSDDPPCPTPTCTDPDTGRPICCTGDCAVIAHDIPQYDLIDANNPQTGGVLITHAGMPPDALDPFKCNPDSQTGCYGERQLTVRLGCDQSSKDRTKLTVRGITEPGGAGSCKYVMDATSPAACGVVGDPYDPYRDNPADSFGYVVLGAALTIFISYGYSFGDNRGWWEPVKRKLQDLPVVGKYIGGSSKSSVFGGSSSYKTVSASAATPITASAYGT